MVTTRPFSKTWNNSSSLIKLKPKLQHISNFANILDWKIEHYPNLLSSIAWINLNFPICNNISKPQKFNIDYNFHRTLLTNTHRKHILFLLVLYSENFRKLQELLFEYEWNESRTQKRKSIRLLIKRWNFSSMTILKPPNSKSLVGGITNKIMLFCLYSITKKINFFSYNPKVH